MTSRWDTRSDKSNTILYAVLVGGANLATVEGDTALVYRTFTGSAACTTAAFGTDPLPNAVKSCHLTR
jgi:hypothetical protein